MNDSNMMKYSSDSSSTLFCEQVGTVTSLFEKWSDCERTVVIYALLKRLRYPSLKFLLHSIENNLTPSSGVYNNMPTFDINANSSLYIENLITAYKSLSSIESTDNADKETIYFGSDFIFKNDAKMFNKKEQILNEVLEILPLLKPGNDEVKMLYLSLIPMAVEDTGREVVSSELVQQIFSYLLIHPAISNEDRRSLSHWLRNLEENIQSSFASVGHQNFYVLSNNTDACSSNSSTSVASSVGSITTKNAWQAIAPPQQSTQKAQSQVSDTTEWNVNIPPISDNICDNFSGININELDSSQNSLGLSYGGTANGVGIISTVNTNTEDHHTSFSRNGTEIIDFDSNTCENCSCAQIGNPSSLNTFDNFNENRWSLDGKIACLKTRRSNSLTTTSFLSSFKSANASVSTVNDYCSDSSENLAQYALKPRSFSLSIENPRSTLVSSDSDSRLDELKSDYLKFTTHDSGMSNIGQWLKSLRLHKYIDLFKNITYESMLEITEEYLQDLGVTKGASHKLALCIEKLKDRQNSLTRIEQESINGQLKLNLAIEELAAIVLTPMKPVDAVSENVAFKFLKVVDLISDAILQRETGNQTEEENVSILLWILDRTIHGEAFTGHINQIKELKFKIAKLKIMYAPKSHHLKSLSSSNLTKPRWNCKTRKTDQKNGSNDKISRKNSNDMISYSLDCSQKLNVVSQRSHVNKNTNNTTGKTSQHKSSSYPNFSSGRSVPVQTFYHLKPQGSQKVMFVNQTNFVPTSTNQQHRRSLNNLIVSSSGQSSSVIRGSNSPISSKNSSLSSNECNNRKAMPITEQELIDIHPKPTSSNVAAKKLLGKTMAAVVLVSNKNCEVLDDIGNFENNYNNVKNNRSAKVLTVGLCTSSNACASAFSNNFCTSITDNSFTSNLLIGKEKTLKNNNVYDIKSLEQLEFLCLQMTEQAIN